MKTKKLSIDAVCNYWGIDLLDLMHEVGHPTIHLHGETECWFEAISQHRWQLIIEDQGHEVAFQKVFDWTDVLCFPLVETLGNTCVWTC